VRGDDREDERGEFIHQGQLIEKEDQKSLLMIGGIKVFLPYSLVEARCVLPMQQQKEGQPAVTVKEMEQMSEAAQGEEEEHADKMLTPWEKELEMLEDWLKNPEPVDDCQEQTVMQMLAEEHSKESLRNFSQGDEQMMMTVMPRHAAIDEGKFQSEEQLEEAGIQPAQEEMVEAKLSEGEAEKRLSDQTAELNFVAEWQAEATEEENSMGDLVDLPIDKDEEVQLRRLHKESQPLDQLDEVIEGIRRLMLRSDNRNCQ
jgi:hypothetical protein